MFKFTTLIAIGLVAGVAAWTVVANQRPSQPLAQQQVTGQWIQLFNGENLDGWTPKFRGHEAGVNYKDTFRVEDGLLRVVYDDYVRFDRNFGHLFYKDKFSHYRLRVTYRFTGDQTPGGPGWAFRNNGIMFHSQSPQSMGLNQDFPVSIEAQLLGGDGQNERSNLNVCTPGTHIVMNDELITRHCTSATISRTFHGDDWVTVEIEVRGNEVVRHKVEDGTVVLEYHKPQLDPNHSDVQGLIEDGNVMLSEGYIAIQAESHATDFRKIELMVLEP